MILTTLLLPLALSAAPLPELAGRWVQSGGRQSYRRSCGGSGETTLPASTGRYDARNAAGQLTLS